MGVSVAFLFIKELVWLQTKLYLSASKKLTNAFRKNGAKIGVSTVFQKRQGIRNYITLLWGEMAGSHFWCYSFLQPFCGEYRRIHDWYSFLLHFFKS